MRTVSGPLIADTSKIYCHRVTHEDFLCPIEKDLNRFYMRDFVEQKVNFGWYLIAHPEVLKCLDVEPDLMKSFYGVILRFSEEAVGFMGY